MNEFVLSGTWGSALSHLALFGLGAIIEESDPMVKVHWQPTLNPRPTLATVLTEDQLGAVVQTQARGALARWVGATFEHEGRLTGSFSPRIKVPSDSASWRRLAAARHEWLSDEAMTQLDRRMIGSLGEPGYWCHDFKGKLQPNWAASTWEMKTRNKGEEFVQNRLALLAKAVSARSPHDILAGLTGVQVKDEAGKNQESSRTPTGLTPPRRTDNALAWCALWGLSSMPVRPATAAARGSLKGQNRSYVAGAARVGGATVKWLPVFGKSSNMARVRAVLRSAQLHRFGMAVLDSQQAGESRAADSAWLRTRGCRAVMFYPEQVSDNDKAPEHWLGSGTRVAIEP